MGRGYHFVGVLLHAFASLSGKDHTVERIHRHVTGTALTVERDVGSSKRVGGRDAALVRRVEAVVRLVQQRAAAADAPADDPRRDVGAGLAVEPRGQAVAAAHDLLLEAEHAGMSSA